MQSSVPIVIGWDRDRRKICSIDGGFHKAWTLNGSLLGKVDAIELNAVKDVKRVSAYVAGYVLKKMGEKEKCLPGKEFEFISMSKKPGLGFYWVDRLYEEMKRNQVGPKHYDGTAVQNSLQMITIDGKLYPLSRTFRDKLKAKFGEDPRSPVNKALVEHLKATKDDVLRDTEEYEREKTENSAKASRQLKKYLASRI